MKVKVLPGKYVLAVSGGVDSMSLLDILTKQKDLEIVVAHFNHGIRRDSGQDEQLVREIAKKDDLALEIGRAKLGSGASEEKARSARYGFLNGVKNKHKAKAIITAHHQDDLIETAFLNLLRGTNRRGLTAISDSDIVRPLLGTPKTKIVRYAKANNLKWIEDSTNGDINYARNHLRQNVLQNLSSEDREAIISNFEKVAIINKNLNQQIATISQTIEVNGQIDRGKFIDLPPVIANELVTSWLREMGVRDFDRKTVDRLSLSLKISQPNTEQPVKKNLKLKIDKKFAHFTTTEHIA